jgi:hypothetical protein
MQPRMLDLDPYQRNTDPKHCVRYRFLFLGQEALWAVEEEWERERQRRHLEQETLAALR